MYHLSGYILSYIIPGSIKRLGSQTNTKNINQTDKLTSSNKYY